MTSDETLNQVMIGTKIRFGAEIQRFRLDDGIKQMDGMMAVKALSRRRGLNSYKRVEPMKRRP